MARNGPGFEDEARQRVIDAARRSGMSVGDLVQALADPSRRTVSGRAAAAPVAPTLGGDLERRLDDLSERMRRLGGERAPRASRAEDADEAALEEIAATVGRLAGASRPAAPAEPRRGDDTGRILETLEALDRRVRALADERAPRRAAVPTRPQPAIAPPPPAADPIVETPAARPRRAVPVREAIAAAETTPTPVDPLDRRLRALDEKIDQLRQRDEPDGSATLLAEIRTLRGLVESRAGGAGDISAEVRRLAGKIDRLADRNPQREVLEALTTELGRLRDVVLQSNVEGSLRSIEEGYGHIVDRLDDLKRRLASRGDEGRIDGEIAKIRDLLRAVPQADHLTALERNLATLADKFDRLATREETPAVQQIERRLGDLRAQIETLDPAKLVVSLDQRLKAVADKLDAVERSTRAPAAQDRVVPLLEELRTLAAGNRTAEDIRALEDRLGDLADRISEFESRRPSYEDTDRLHGRIAEIADRLDRIATSDDGRRSVEALESAVSRLDAAIARGAPQTSELIDARFDELFERIDRRLPPDPTAEVEELTRQISAMRHDLVASRSNDELEEQMRLLAERLDRSVTHESDDDTLAQIEEQLAQIAKRIETTQERGPDLSALEGHILRLADRMEAQQLGSVEAARQAAREMVSELAAGRRDDGVAEAALQALQTDLRSLQSAARDTETRTNDTLVSLHDALTGIVGRLAAIEKIAQGSARSAAAARNAAQAAESAAQAAVQPKPEAEVRVPPVAARSEPRSEEIAAEAPAQPTIAGRPVGVGAVTRARELLAAATPDDNRPLEPGSGKPSTRSLAAEPAVAPAAAATPAAARKADFIAAARRAAQAAVDTAATAPVVGPADRPTGPAAAPAAEETAEKADGALSRIGKVLKNRRRPLVLATAALVLAILTLQVMPSRKAPEKTAEAETRIERSVATVDTGVATPAERAAETAAPTAADQMLSKTPAATPQVGFSLPLATEPAKPAAPAAAPLAAAPAVPHADPAARPADDGAPATTGSIPATAAAAPTAAATPVTPASGDALPEKIGSADLRAAATGGDPKAAFEVALRFAEGRSVPADLAKAAEWYRKAAEGGLAPAQYRLGIAYEKGLGVGRDAEQAKVWYKAAAEKGNVRAMHNLGVLYANARDMANAVPWFQKAGDHGLRDSQFNLGIINALGSGVKQDLAVSYKWFALAARQGDAEAEKKMTEVASHLDKVTLAAARMAVQTWVQRPADRSANDEVRAWGEPATASAAPAAADPAAQVRQAQQLLKTMGLYAGSVDGDAGPGTKAAIRSFQKKAGLPQTGEVDGALLQALAGRAL